MVMKTIKSVVFSHLFQSPLSFLVVRFFVYLFVLYVFFSSHHSSVHLFSFDFILFICFSFYPFIEPYI